MSLQGNVEVWGGWFLAEGAVAKLDVHEAHSSPGLS